MRGKNFKDPILSKVPAPESPVQIISDHSPPHPEMTKISSNLTTECEKEIKENLNDTSTDLQDVSSHRNKIIPKHHDPNTALVPHKSTWINSLVEHLWWEQKRKKDDEEEENSAITLQNLIFQLYGQYFFDEALWIGTEEENE